MKIWILEIGEPLPLERDVRLHRYGLFTQALAGRGHEVTWWTSSFSHAPKTHFADRDQDIEINGVRLRIIRGPGYARNVSLARIRHNQHFAARFAEWAKKSPPPDLIISPIPIIEAAREAVAYGLAHNIPVLTDIRDLWPDELKDRAPKPLRWLARWMLTRAYKSMQFVCKNASGIMAISESYLDYGLSFAGRGREPNDLFFPLGYSRNRVSPEKLTRAMNWCAAEGIRESAFVVCFIGTIGQFFDLETVIKAARILEKQLDIQFVLAGAGSELERIRQMARGVKSVILPGWLDQPRIEALMSISNVGLAPYRRGANMTLPNKPFEYMAGGLPLLSSLTRELPELLIRHQCGLSYQANSVDDLCTQLRWMINHRKQSERMGERARALFEAQFTTESIFARIERELVRIAGQRPIPISPGQTRETRL